MIGPRRWVVPVSARSASYVWSPVMAHRRVQRARSLGQQRGHRRRLAAVARVHAPAPDAPRWDAAHRAREPRGRPPAAAARRSDRAAATTPAVIEPRLWPRAAARCSKSALAGAAWARRSLPRCCARCALVLDQRLQVGRLLDLRPTVVAARDGWPARLRRRGCARARDRPAPSACAAHGCGARSSR